MGNYKAVLFDFDYTLADSSPGIIECINYALKEMGLEPVTQQEACETIGLSLPDTFSRLTENRNAYLTDRFAKLFVKRADEVMVDMTCFFEDVPYTVRALKEKGLKLGIVSTKFRYRIEMTLERHGLEGLFDIIIGGEDVEKHKPDPQGILLGVKSLGITPLEVLYTGDSITDAEAAKRAGVAFAAVLTGVTPRQAFLNYEGCTIIKRLKEVCANII